MLGRLTVPKIIYVRPVGSPENTSNIEENPNINNLTWPPGPSPQQPCGLFLSENYLWHIFSSEMYLFLVSLHWVKRIIFLFRGCCCSGLSTFLKGRDAPFRRVRPLSLVPTFVCPLIRDQHGPKWSKRPCWWKPYSAPDSSIGKIWMATKAYLNHRGTRIRVFRVWFQAPFLPPFFPHFSSLFPLQALFTLPPLLPSSHPPSSLFWLLENSLWFRYPSDLGTL